MTCDWCGEEITEDDIPARTDEGDYVHDWCLDEIMEDKDEDD